MLAKRESKVHCTCLDIFQHFFWLILCKHKTLPHNYSSTMVVCLHSSMVQISKKFNMPSDKLVILPTEFLQPRKKLIFPYRIYVNFPTGIKDLPIANRIPIGFEQNS